MKSLEKSEAEFFTHRLPAHSLMRWATECFATLSLPDEIALLLAQSLVRMSLLELGSRGVGRLLLEIDAVSKDGWVEPDIAVQFTGESIARVDGGASNGILVAHHSNELAILHAIATGVGAVSIKSLFDCGGLPLYTRRAAEIRLVSIATSPMAGIPTEPTDHRVVSPTRARISVAFQCEPVVVTSLDVEDSDLSIYAGINQNGQDRSSLFLQTLLAPYIGSALLVDILNMFAWQDRAGPVFLVIDPARLSEGMRFMEHVVETIESIRRSSNSVRVQTDQVTANETARRAYGIPITQTQERQITTWSKTLGVVPPSCDQDDLAPPLH
ncbi:MAG: Ldh family oxidoreductase [Burkholderiales bacterium]|nr:Ldh family oxidoreductase [Burkholderiales bacterium]